KGLKDDGFHQAALTSIKIWQNLGHTKSESDELVAQMRRFEVRLPPFNLPYVSGIDTPKIWWGSFKNQPRHLAELACRIFSINPTQANACNLSTVGNIISFEENQISDDEILLDTPDYPTTLLINEVINLDKENSESSIAELS
ncbi:36865_t:CDS:2, partial [Gigaspora margarita]